MADAEGAVLSEVGGVELPSEGSLRVAGRELAGEGEHSGGEIVEDVVQHAPLSPEEVVW
jgi:hypothetical protein